MRWLSFERCGKPTFGVVKDDCVVDIGALEPGLADLRAAIGSGRIAELEAKAANLPADIPLTDIRYLPVIPNPDKILCVGLNYKDHQAESGSQGEPYPTIFVRLSSAQVGHEAAICRPIESRALDYEGEIALIVGVGGRRIDKDDWRSHVAGFAPYNDASVRDWQRHSSQYTPGKNFADTGGFGPWMMTLDEIGDPDAMQITTRLNGEVMQHAVSSQLVFGFGELIAYCSTFIGLEPGDVIVTGTPGGVGAARRPPVFMKGGDRIEVEVKPIGTLVNQIVDE